MPIAPPTFCDQARRTRSHRERRDDELKEQINGVHAANFRVHVDIMNLVALSEEGQSSDRGR